MKLNDLVVVITGGTKGLGLALVKKFLEKQAHVAVIAHVPEELNALKTALNVETACADVTNEPALIEAAKNIITKFGRIDIWVNNAGIWLDPMPIEKVDMQNAHHLFEVNVFGTIYGTRAALPHLYSQKKGTIINIISRAALGGRENKSLYCASKHAVAGLTKSIRLEAAHNNVQVFGIYPGGIKTGLFNSHLPPDYKEFLTSEEVATTIVTNLEKDTPEEDLLIEK